LQRPAPEANKGVTQLWPCIAAIGEHVAQRRCLAAEPRKDPRRTVAILNASTVDLTGDQMAAGVGDDVTLSPLIFFPAS
jgi:hypothetical protein